MKIRMLALAIILLFLSSNFLSFSAVEPDINYSWQIIECEETIDPFNSVVPINEKVISKKDLAGIVLYDSNNKQAFADFELEGNKVVIKMDNELTLEEDYSLRIFMEDGRRYKYLFKTGGLPDISATGERFIIKVPAMPEEGFSWPYFLAIPSNRYKSENQGQKRYVVVDTNNTGVSQSAEQCIKDTAREIEERRQYSMSLAEELWSPMLMPAFPRPDAAYEYEDEFNAFYTHALDRDTAALHVKMEDEELSEMLAAIFEENGYDIKQFERLDLQLKAMIDHAVKYLNKYDHKVEKKVFLSGYSASGTFVDRFAALQPDMVKAVCSGATLDDMLLPLSTYNNEKLIFPIGTYDYKKLTGRSFSLAQHNKVARLIYMGEEDTNNVVPFSDCYGDTERDIITKLWGMEILPRAKSLTELYGKSGGKGIFILDKGVQHGSSRQMDEYLLEFLKANRNSSRPVYPTPDDKDNLKYTIYD